MRKTQTLSGCVPSLVTTTMQPLWKPAPLRLNSASCYPAESFLFVRRFVGKIIFAESHSGATVDSSGNESSPRISQERLAA